VPRKHSVPATCHPERPRKLRDGTCDRCYARNKYQNDPATRERVQRKAREHWHRTQREYTSEQLESRKRAQRKRYARNPDRFASHSLKTAFGITLSDYNRMLLSQGGVCAICAGENQVPIRFAVDHCHATQVVRGLLCKNCNTGLGLFNDDVGKLHAAIRYLSKHISVLDGWSQAS
jgi:hypothetical protein